MTPQRHSLNFPRSPSNSTELLTSELELGGAQNEAPPPPELPADDYSTEGSEPSSFQSARPFQEASSGSPPARADFSKTKTSGRVPPHSLEAEQSVIGAVLLDNESLNAVVEVLVPDDFYVKSHQIIFQAMLDLSERNQPIDIVTLSESMRNELSSVGGIEYLSKILDVTPMSANAQYYARLVRETSIRRRLIHEVSEIAHEAFNTSDDIGVFIDRVEQKIFKVSESRINQSFYPISKIVVESIKEVERLRLSKTPITGVPTGFVDFDNMTFGLQASDLVILAGRPAMGKTSLALSMAKHIALEEQRAVAVFSLEMSKEQISMRLLTSEARVDSAHVRSGRFVGDEFSRLVGAASSLAQAKLFIDDTPAISVLEMRAKSRRLHKEHPLGLIIVDYLQLMRGSGRSNERREQEISEISGSLKALAKELKVPVIALSQLNRAVENRTDKRPLMADLRESGAIEQDADMIGFVYRDEVYNPDTPDKGIAELIIGKHRNGPTGTVKMSFIGQFTLFENLSQREDYDYLGPELGVEDDEIL